MPVRGGRVVKPAGVVHNHRFAAYGFGTCAGFLIHDLKFSHVGTEFARCSGRKRRRLLGGAPRRLGDGQIRAGRQQGDKQYGEPRPRVGREWSTELRTKRHGNLEMSLLNAYAERPEIAAWYRHDPVTNDRRTWNCSLGHE